VVLVALCATALAWGVSPARAGTFSDPAFESVTLASGLDFPTTVTWAPDGRMFIAEKFGYVRVVQPNGTLMANPIIDIHDQIVSSGDRGLLGLAAAPPDGNGDLRLYMLYTHRAPGETDAQAATESLSAVSTLTYVTVHPNNTVDGGTNGVDPTQHTVIGSETSTPTSTASDTAQACTAETDDCIPSEGYTHTIGTVQIDPNDGSLWVSTGDGYADGAYIDPNSGSYHLRSQDPSSLAGKILHIHPDGTGFAGSPYCPPPATSTSSNCSKVWAEGFRNPFRFTLRQVSAGVSRPVGGDVGEGNWEELNDASRGYNAGWPCYEGNTPAGSPPYSNSTQCTTLGTGYDHPFYLFDHYEGGFPGPNYGGAIVGGPVYTGSTYPSTYKGQVFNTDYVHGWINYRQLTDDAQHPDTSTNTFLSGDAGGRGTPYVSLQQAPDGNLVDVEIYDSGNPGPAGGSVNEIRYSPSDKSPVARASVPASCTTSQNVQFTGDASVDPDGDKTLSYFWDFGDGSTSTGSDLAHADPLHHYASAGTYEVRLRVTDSHGNSNNAFLTLTIGPGATPPNASITAPTPGSPDPSVSADKYIAGKKITLSGGTTSGAGSQMSWEPVLVHGGTHTHVLGSIPTPTGDVPDSANGVPEFDADNVHGADSYYILRFTVTKNGCSTTLSERMNPQTGGYAMNAQDQSPGGGAISVPLTFIHTSIPDTAPAPHTFTVAKNAKAIASAPPTWVGNGWTYTFDHWVAPGNVTLPSATAPVQPFSDNLSASSESITAFYTHSNHAPTASISNPASNSAFVSRRPLTVTSSSSDPEDGTLSGSSLAWTISRTANGTTTGMGTGSGSSFTFTPDAAGDLRATYAVTLTATDSHGATSTTHITLHAASAHVTLASRPAGIDLTAGTATHATPFSVGPLISGAGLAVSAPASPSVGGVRYLFVGWSDGGAAAHTFTVPAADATLTASYAPPARVVLAHLVLHKPRMLGGTLTGGAAPVTRLRLALRPAKVKGMGCLWWSVKRHRLVRARKGCGTPSWLTARLHVSHGVTHWTLNLGGTVPPGAYRLLSQVRDRAGHLWSASAALTVKR
jgi:glucose/arabinose dehydrogenase